MINGCWWAFTFREDLSVFCTEANMTMADMRQKLLVGVLCASGRGLVFLIANTEQ